MITKGPEISPLIPGPRSSLSTPVPRSISAPIPRHTRTAHTTSAPQHPKRQVHRHHHVKHPHHSGEQSGHTTPRHAHIMPKLNAQATNRSMRNASRGHTQRPPLGPPITRSQTKATGGPHPIQNTIAILKHPPHPTPGCRKPLQRTTRPRQKCSTKDRPSTKAAARRPVQRLINCRTVRAITKHQIILSIIVIN